MLSNAYFEIIFLQNFVLIQPRTSPPKICKIFEKCIFEKCIFEGSGPYARTDGELQAVKQAELASDLAAQAVEYTEDVQKRVTAAA